MSNAVNSNLSEVQHSNYAHLISSNKAFADHVKLNLEFSIEIMLVISSISWEASVLPKADASEASSAEKVIDSFVDFIAGTINDEDECFLLFNQLDELADEFF